MLALARSWLYDGRMWTGRVTTDRLLLLSILALAGIAHFVPVFTTPRFTPTGRVRFGWEVAHWVIGCLYEFAGEQIRGQRIGIFGGWYTIVGCLSNPLFWAGVAVLLLGKRLSRQKAGITAALTGVAALLCTLGFSASNSDVTLLLGFYLWMASILLLTLTGVWQAMERRPGGHGPRLGEMKSPGPARPCG